MKKKLFSLMVAAFAVGNLLVSCSDSEATDLYGDRPVYKTLDEDAKELIAENGQVFAFDVMSNAYTLSTENDNICLSPYSAFMSLCALANGNEGDARIAVLNEMGFNGMFDVSLLNEYIGETNKKIVFGPDMTDFSASCQHLSSLWFDSETEVENGFADILKNHYSTEILARSPKGGDGLSLMNEWVRTHKAVRLDDFIKTPIEDDMALIDLLLFHGNWTNPFSKKSTCPLIFKNNDGTESAVNAMRLDRPAKYLYGYDEECEMLALPFSSSESVRLYVLMPRSGVEFGSFFRNLSRDKFMELKEGAVSRKVDLRMPPFSVTSRFNLLSLLPNGNREISLNKVVPEEGSVSMTCIPHMGHMEIGLTETYYNPSMPEAEDYSVAGDDSVSVSVDRPFVYILEHEETGVFIMMGCVVKM